METLRHFEYGNLAREVLPYHVHRILHHPWFYARHHKLHHSFVAPVAFTGLYTMPVEHFFADINTHCASACPYRPLIQVGAYSIVQCLSHKCASRGYGGTQWV